MRVAVLTPLPPVRSGIANYSAMLLPGLARRIDTTAVIDQNEVESIASVPTISLAELQERRGEFDHVIYQLGNNLHHELVYREAAANPGIAVLHDAVLHHLIAEMTIARGDAREYGRILGANHGSGGEAYARAIAVGLHLEIGKFLFPASIELANRSRHVIVHNEWAAKILRSLGARKPISVVPHPLVMSSPPSGPEEIRRRLGFSAHHRVVGMFGFVTGAKRPEVVFESFARASSMHPDLRLLVVGQPSPDVHLERLASRFGLADGVWFATGYVSDEEFDSCLQVVDRVVNLRYPSAGETSGALLRILAAGKPVAVSDYAQFGEFPEGVAVRIPFGDEEADRLFEFLTDSFDEHDPETQRAWIRSHAGLDEAIDGYVRVLEGEGQSTEPRRVLSTMPLLVDLQVAGFRRQAPEEGGRLEIRLRNRGDSHLRAAAYGEPHLVIIARVMEREAEVSRRRLSLDRDLLPGQEWNLELELPPGGMSRRLELFHAVDEFPILESKPFFSQELHADLR